MLNQIIFDKNIVFYFTDSCSISWAAAILPLIMFWFETFASVAKVVISFMISRDALLHSWVATEQVAAPWWTLVASNSTFNEAIAWSCVAFSSTFPKNK